AQFVLDLFVFFRKAYQDSQGFDYPPVHDPCTVAYLIDPSIVKTVRVPINIELRGELTVGMTVADFREPAGEECHTKAATDLDFARFWELVIDSIDRIQKGDC
ncbi:nucleoside hydrolase, partial [Varibaculum cambriense]